MSELCTTFKIRQEHKQSPDEQSIPLRNKQGSHGITLVALVMCDNISAARNMFAQKTQKQLAESHGNVYTC